MPNMIYRLGVDIGSTTVKIALLDDQDRIVFSDYKRHFANIRETLLELVQEAKGVLSGADGGAGDAKDIRIRPVITGSGGLALAGALDIPFNQEVIAERAPKLQETFGPRKPNTLFLPH